MAWTLCEELLKAAVVFLAGFFLKGTWRVVMETKQCMIAGCRRVSAKRGLCLVCYSRAKVKVESGEVTWDKLVKLELCGNTSGDPFDDAYNRAMED